MDIRPIRTEADYDWALREIAPYFEREPAPGTGDADRFDVLATLIEAYEARHWPIGLPDPLAGLQHYMALREFGQAELASVLGSRSRASELLAGKRPLTLAQIRRLRAAWGIPLELLISSDAKAA